jgi:hypothetical protein
MIWIGQLQLYTSIAQDEIRQEVQHCIYTRLGLRRKSRGLAQGLYRLVYTGIYCVAVCTDWYIPVYTGIYCTDGYIPVYTGI